MNEVIENWQQNPDGITWSEAISEPFYGLRNKCSCGKKFWKNANYREHYRIVHTDRIRYIRLRKGGMEPVGQHKHSFSTAGFSDDTTCDTCGVRQIDSWILL